MSNRITVEKNKRFSECCLWQMQRDYFEREGVDAWVNQVPFYVTSNPFIANSYATMVMQFMRDWAAQHPESQQQPFYILELGTGCGRFSFLVLKRLYELRQESRDKINFVYVMSDFTRHNIQYWERHPALQTYLQEGLLDFASYNLEVDESIKLEKSGKILSPQTLVNPLTVFANYIFDTVSADAFSVKNGKLNELQIVITTEPHNMLDGKPIDWEKFNIDYQPREISSDYYEDPAFNAMLEEYRTTLKDSSFLVPIGGLRALKRLRTLANDKLFLISSDKGYSSLESMENLSYPKPAFHGSFSMMVNFHAVASYFKHSGGHYILQTPRKGIKTVAFCSGFDLKTLPEAYAAANEAIEGFSPADYFILHRRISDSYQECALEILASHLALAGWDPHIYLRINNRMCSIAAEADDATLEFLTANMPKIMANFYHLPKSDNLPFEIGYFFHSAKRYGEALKYYKQAMNYGGEQFGLMYNTALCLYYNGEVAASLDSFKRAQAINPDSKEANEWIAFVESNLQEQQAVGD